jgi:hypothetical protein
LADHCLAQLNIARLREPLESASMADFVGNLDRINALAEQSPGFVWRFKEDSGSSDAQRVFGDDVIVNMSVWQDAELLNQFAYKSAHVDIMRRRREWFHRMAEAYAVLWWVPLRHTPTLEEAAQRLGRLREFGPTCEAFTFKDPFPAPSTE